MDKDQEFKSDETLIGSFLFNPEVSRYFLALHASSVEKQPSYHCKKVHKYSVKQHILHLKQTTKAALEAIVQQSSKLCHRAPRVCICQLRKELNIVLG